ncbi:MAG: archaeal proteasome endopeptidase complex subunit beta [Candidatus Caldarchaeum sp.]|nr:archaeal proteasome endopeptidase complex subunit beta [Candidatus Caldarchaeum sp.]MDW8435050.1 archaeal proteasome endopeptidase complex subunit beta [Candidatus Caldarchaeum sp.]
MYQHDKPKVLSTGTTTVGMVVKDAVVVATDTRVTAGFFVAHRRGKKVFPLAKHAAITIAGRVADAQTLIDLLKANINYYQIMRDRPMPLQAVARLTSSIMFNSRFFPYYAQLIIAGIDDEGPHLFNLDPFGSVTEEKLIATGSGSPVAYGVLEPNYREDMSFESGIELAFQAVSAAIRRDAGTGDSIDVAYVLKDKGYGELSLDEKAPLYRKYFTYLPVT